MENDFPGFSRMRPIRVEELISALLLRATNRETSAPDRLWHAARNTLPVSARLVMRHIEREFPLDHLKNSSHILLLVQRMEREVEWVASKSLGDETHWELATGLLIRYAKKRRMRIDEVVNEWSQSCWAIREVAIEMGITLIHQAPQQKLPAIFLCDRCWRTGDRTYKGGYLCALHKPGTAAYRRALRLDVWRHPSQEWPESYEILVLRRLARTANCGLGYFEGEKPMLKLRLGQAEALEEFEEHIVDMRFSLERLPHARRFLRLKAKGLMWKLKDAATVLSYLDPLVEAGRYEQSLVHKAMIRDQRYILEMLNHAEAWLETDKMMNDAWGGDRMSKSARSADSALVSFRPVRS